MPNKPPNPEPKCFEPDYLIIPSLNVTRSDLQPIDRIVLLLLQGFCAGQFDNDAWSGPLDVIADLCGISQKIGRGSLERLEKAGAIRIERRAGQPNRYSIAEPFGYLNESKDIVWAKTAPK